MTNVCFFMFCPVYIFIFTILLMRSFLVIKVLNFLSLGLSLCHHADQMKESKKAALAQSNKNIFRGQDAHFIGALVFVWLQRWWYDNRSSMICTSFGAASEIERLLNTLRLRYEFAKRKDMVSSVTENTEQPMQSFGLDNLIVLC